MQTFLPFADFEQSARAEEIARLRRRRRRAAKRAWATPRRNEALLRSSRRNDAAP
jgi:hypothetical protein